MMIRLSFQLSALLPWVINWVSDCARNLPSRLTLGLQVHEFNSVNPLQRRIFDEKRHSQYRGWGKCKDQDVQL